MGSTSAVGQRHNSGVPGSLIFFEDIPTKAKITSSYQKLPRRYLWHVKVILNEMLPGLAAD